MSNTWSLAQARYFALSSPPEPTSKRARLDTDLQYHYLEWDEAKSDHTLVLVHGFLDFSGGWRATVAQGLHEHFHILAPDMRGHGDSDRIGPGGYYHFFDYIADLRSFIESLGRERISLVGHSMGGSIAGYYAGSFPDDLANLVLMEGMGPPEDPTPAPDRVKHWVRGWKRASARSPHRYASVDEAAEKLRARDPLLSAELATDLATWGTRELETGERVFKHDPLHLSLGPVRYSVDTAMTFWERITCPVLLVEGADSRMIHSSEESARRHSALRAPQLARIEGAGHMIQRHKPAELSQILLDFLS